MNWTCKLMNIHRIENLSIISWKSLYKTLNLPERYKTCYITRGSRSHEVLYLFNNLAAVVVHILTNNRKNIIFIAFYIFYELLPRLKYGQYPFGWWFFRWCMVTVFIAFIWWIFIMKCVHSYVRHVQNEPHTSIMLDK